MKNYLMVSLLALACASPALAQTDDTATSPLKTSMKNADGKQLGTATLTETPNGVLIQADLQGLPPGEHGFHIHQTGTCDAEGGFKSAGGHYAPNNSQHGFKVEDGPHAGDLPNQIVDENGRLRADVLAANVTLDSNGEGTLLDSDGSALVIHAKADDYRSQPSGNAGDRLACAVISNGTQQSMADQDAQQAMAADQTSGQRTDTNFNASQNRQAADRTSQRQRTTALDDNDRTVNDASSPDVTLTVALIRQGWSAKELIDQNVYGGNRSELGEIQDIIVERDGTIKALIVEGGGFLDIGDSTFRIPWSQVNLTPGRDGVSIPVSEDQAENKGWYEKAETVRAGPQEFRVNQLIGEYSQLKNGAGYGYVSDVVFGRDGKILSVLVNRDFAYGGGTFGYPYDRNSDWRPGSGDYALPFSSLEMAATAPRVDSERATTNQNGQDDS